jgi:C1A family cysteine protease
MQSIFVAAAAAATASALTVEESHIARFNNWKAEHGKSYTSIEQEELRFEIFMQNHESITAHNADSTQTYTMAHNSFSDYSPEEFKSMYTGYVPQEGHKSGADNVHEIKEDAPASKDWRTTGKVTAVKNQGQCGSCWAFSTTGSIEAANLIKNGGSASDKANIISEQELVDCSRANAGCNGGLMDLGFQFVKNQGAGGDDLENSYPYKARNGRCVKQKGVPSKIQVTSYTDVTSGSEDALANAIGTHGPVSVAIEADQRAFQFYNGGVLTSGCGQNLDHGVLAVGYTDEYFIVKNSWGPSWGEEGYIKIGRGKNLCGIANQASYPTVL